MYYLMVQVSSNQTCSDKSSLSTCLLQEKAVIQAVCLRTQTVSIKARFKA